MTEHQLLAVNFRDPGHPDAGGAELHLAEILLEGLRRGFRVTWLASGFHGCTPESEYRGLRIVRRGSWWNFNWVVPGVLKREFAKPPPELLVEDINKVPCFTPWWTEAPVAVIVPHLFGGTAVREMGLAVALYVLALEKLIPFCYRRASFLTISESTRDDLVRRGIRPQRISIVHCGLDHTSYRYNPAVPKSERPVVLYIGRLRRYKGIDWVLRALSSVLSTVPSARFVVIGDGPFASKLRVVARRLGVNQAVDFLGFLPHAEKIQALQDAWVLVQPSPNEGWGLTVMEAGACGTAVVAADSPGLRDSVKRDVTGLLVPFGDDRALADAISRVLNDGVLRKRLSAGGLAWAARFTWGNCACHSLDVLLNGLSQRES